MAFITGRETPVLAVSGNSLALRNYPGYNLNNGGRDGEQDDASEGAEVAASIT